MRKAGPNSCSTIHTCTFDNPMSKEQEFPSCVLIHVVEPFV
jgi:hypothetical protein